MLRGTWCPLGTREISAGSQPVLPSPGFEWAHEYAGPFGQTGNGGRVAYDRRWYFVLACACILYAAMRFWGLADYCLDGDEIFSLRAARHDVGRLLSTAVSDISHPPLFYLLLKFWIEIGGQSLAWLRLLPVMMSIATLLPVLLVCRELRLRPWETAIVVALLAVNGLLIQFAQHLRMFVLLQFFAAWSVWAFVRLIKYPKLTWRNAVVCFLVNLGLVYSHYWGWVLLASESLVLLALARSKLIPVLIIGVALVICYSPWVYAIWTWVGQKGTATGQISWIGKPGWPDIALFYGSLNGPFAVPRSTTAGLLLFGVPVLLMAARINWRVKSQRCGDAAFFVSMAVLAIVPVIATFLVSHIATQSVWAVRQLIMVALPYYMLVAVAACRLKKTWTRRVIVGAILGWALISGIAVQMEPARKISWDTLVERICRAEEQSATPTIVYATDAFVASPLEFYANDGGTERLDVRTNPHLERLEGDHFWVAFRDTTWKEHELPEARLAAMGFRVGEAFSAGTRSQTVTAFPVWRR